MMRWSIYLCGGLLAIFLSQSALSQPAAPPAPEAQAEAPEIPLPTPPAEAPLEEERPAPEAPPVADAAPPAPGEPRDPFAPSPKMRELLDRQRVGAPDGRPGGPGLVLPAFRMVGYGDNGVHPPVAILEVGDETLVVREGNTLHPHLGVAIRVQTVGADGVVLEIEELGETMVVR
jgi:hypothetical protein